MGATNSRLEEDKGLQLCRARKKFIKQALNGRCSLAAAHIAYIEELKIIGNTLRRFVENDPQIEPFHPPLGPRALTENSISSRSFSHNVEPAANISLSPSTPQSRKYHSHHMKFRGVFSKKVVEKPPEPVTLSVLSNTPPTVTNAPEPFETFETPTVSETTPWDYFGLFHPIDDHFPPSDDHGNPREKDDEEPNLEDVEDKFSSDGIEEGSSQGSEDEFEEPSPATLVRSFKNVNLGKENGDSSRLDLESGVEEVKENLVDGDLQTPLRGASSMPVNPEIKFGNVMMKNENNSPGLSPLRGASSMPIKPEIKFGNVMMKNENNSPGLSPLRGASSMPEHLNDMKITPMVNSRREEEEEEEEDKIAPKDFFLSVKDIEQLFFKASEAGKEVPRMLEANKFHFRPVFRGERGSIASSLLKSCLSCGDDPSEIRQEPAQGSDKYLIWHRSTSFRSGSSRNLLGTNSADDAGNNLFDTFCMVSGSHASTLDRLYAWEKKLYDEVKAGDVLRSHFDRKCKLLRQQESRGENTDKTRAVVKDLHSRIGVAVHRINSISKKIEEIRDKELQPQLEELIEGLRKMWEQMLESHKLQFHIISISQTPSGGSKLITHSDSRRHITILLVTELSNLSSAFTKWIGAQRLYVDSIEKWLFKCVFLKQNTSKRNRRSKPPSLRNMGPPIYMICGAWMEMLDSLPAKGVTDSIKDLADEVAHFLPRHEKKSGHSNTQSSTANGDHEGGGVMREEGSEDWIPVLDRFQTRLAGFLGQLNSFAESSVKMFGDLQVAIRQAKENYEQYHNSQQG